jgi:L-iditol 2-dehydrogenase
MAMDILVLNTAVVDFRRKDFDFTDNLAGEGGLARCETEDMPGYSQEQLAEWIRDGYATPGGIGNSAPLMARAGLSTAIGANLGRGQYGGLDAHGRFFYDRMACNGIDLSAIETHPALPTGATFIHCSTASDRLGIVYFPNANDDFSFEVFQKHVERLRPKIVYYIYSGLSHKGDANGGRDLAEFMRCCRAQGAVTIADSHTLTGSPQRAIEQGLPMEEYRLLEPLLPELDIFFTSLDEARLIHNTLIAPATGARYENCARFLVDLCRMYCAKDGRTRMFGVTVSDGAHECHMPPDGEPSVPEKVSSRFMGGPVVDLVGAGDSFRAGLLVYIARNLDGFRSGRMDFAEAVQMGNLFASCYIKAPLGQRYGVKEYDAMLETVRGKAFLTRRRGDAEEAVNKTAFLTRRRARKGSGRSDAEEAVNKTHLRVSASPRQDFFEIPAEMRALVLDGAGFEHLAVRKVPTPRPGPRQLSARVEAAGICTSLIKLIEQGSGHKLLYDWDVTRFPLILGDEGAVTIVEVGEELRERYSVGGRFVIQPAVDHAPVDHRERYRNSGAGVDKVAVGYTLGGHLAEYILVTEEILDAGCLLPMPPEVDAFAHAAMSEPVSCAVSAQDHHVHLSQKGPLCPRGVSKGLKAGGVTVIVGAGAMGRMHLDVALSYGPRAIVVSDLVDDRLEIVRSLFGARAGRLGITLHTVHPDQVQAIIADVTGQGGADDVIVAVGSRRAIEDAQQLVGRGGVLNLFGGLKKGEDTIGLDAGIVHYKEITVTGSSGGSPWDVARTLEMFAGRQIDAGAHITRIGDLEHAAEFLQMVKAQRIDGKAVVYPHRRTSGILAVKRWSAEDERRYLAGASAE